MLLKCQKCGFENQLGTIYCHGCGEKLEVGEVDNESMEEERAAEEAASISWVKTIVSWCSFFVVLVILIALISCAFTTSHAPAIKTISEEEQLNVAQLTQTLESGSGELELTPQEMTQLFRQNILLNDCETDYDTYAVRGIVFEGKDDMITAHVHSNLANREVVFSITGKLKKAKSKSQPVDFQVDGVKMGKMSLWLSADTIYEKFKGTLECDAIKELFNRADKIEFVGGKLKVSLASPRTAAPSKRRNRNTD